MDSLPPLMLEFRLVHSGFTLNHPFVPAEAGTQRLAKELDSRLRGSERSLLQRNAAML